MNSSRTLQRDIQLQAYTCIARKCTRSTSNRSFVSTVVPLVRKFEIILSDFGLFLMSNCFYGKTGAVEIAVKPEILKDKTKNYRKMACNWSVSTLYWQLGYRCSDKAKRLYKEKTRKKDML